MKNITIQLGKKPDLKNLNVSDWAEELLSKVKYSNKKEELELTVMSVEELGFPDGAYLKDIYNKAKELGLELCPAEVGPQLRTQYNDQPKDEWLRIAMEPITVSGGRLRVFRVGRGDYGLWLDGRSGRPDGFRGGGDRFVFVRPRKSFSPLPSLELRILSLEQKMDKISKFLILD